MLVQIALQDVLPTVCAGGLFYYALFVSRAVLQNDLNVSSLGHQDTINYRNGAGCSESVDDSITACLCLCGGVGRIKVDRVLVASERTQVAEQDCNHCRIK